ncbi:MAG: biotin transporter BioY [Candidatus Omnitrophota bacterium]
MRAVSLDRSYPVVREISLIAAFTFLMSMSAYVRVPLFFTPVPLTMQTLILFLSIIALKKRAVISQLFYILLGTAGLPVFTNGGCGILYLAGPTGGYLMGFLIAAAVFPYLLPKENCLRKNVLFFSAAAIVVYCFGIAWLVLIHRFSFSAALIAGFYPFIPGAVIKIALASFLSLSIRNSARDYPHRK